MIILNLCKLKELLQRYPTILFKDHVMFFLFNNKVTGICLTIMKAMRALLKKFWKSEFFLYLGRHFSISEAAVNGGWG